MEREMVACDLDGVICPEPYWLKPCFWLKPLVGVYLRGTFLLKPMYVPNCHMDIITGRPEMDRMITEQWLKKNHVIYRNLYMYPYGPPSINAATYFKMNLIIKLKLDCYIESDEIILKTLSLCLDTDIITKELAFKRKLLKRR